MSTAAHEASMMITVSNKSNHRVCRMFWSRWTVTGGISQVEGDFGGIMPWLVVVAVVVIAVVAGIIPTIISHGSTKHVRKSSVATSTTKTSPNNKVYGYNGKGTAKLSVSLKVSSHTIYGFPRDWETVPIPADSSVTFYLTIRNTGTVPLRDTIFSVSAAPPLYDKASTGLVIMQVMSSPASTPNCGGSYITNQSVCTVNSKGGFTASGASKMIPLVANFNQVSSPDTVPPSFSVAATVKGTAPDGQVVETKTSAVSIKIIPADFNSTLSLHITFNPDPVAPDQVFAEIVTITNNSATTPISNLAIEVPETLGGNPMPFPKGFPSYMCQGLHFAAAVCDVFPSGHNYFPGHVYPTSQSSLAPGASLTMEFAEVVPGPSYPGAPPGYYPPPPKQAFFDAEVFPSTSGQPVYAYASGYVNVS